MWNKNINLYEENFGDYFTTYDRKAFLYWETKIANHKMNKFKL